MAEQTDARQSDQMIAIPLSTIACVMMVLEKVPAGTPAGNRNVASVYVEIDSLARSAVLSQSIEK